MGALGFLLARPKLILGLVVLIFMVSAWAMFQTQAAKVARLETALEDERDMRAAAEAQLAVNRAATVEAETTRQVEIVTRVIEREAERELADAEQRQDAHGMYVAWRAGVERLRDAERAEVA